MEFDFREFTAYMGDIEAQIAAINNPRLKSCMLCYVKEVASVVVTYEDDRSVSYLRPSSFNATVVSMAFVAACESLLSRAKNHAGAMDDYKIIQNVRAAMTKLIYDRVPKEIWNREARQAFTKALRKPSGRSYIRGRAKYLLEGLFL